MQSSRGVIIFVAFMVVSIGLTAQGHRGSIEPPLDKALMELPAIKGTDIVIVYHGFVVNYNIQRLIPNWVAYELTAEELKGDVSRAKRFSMDLDFEKKQAMREDYSNSGWDKGHMAPAADMKWSQLAMNDSFCLTNVCPQNHDLNNKAWHSLEKKVRDWAIRYGKVWVVCGPYVYSNKYGAIGVQNVVVPDGFFKAVLRREGKEYKSIAFVFKNDSKQQVLKETVVSVNDVETLVGYDLFTNLDDNIEESVEAQFDFCDWE